MEIALKKAGNSGTAKIKLETGKTDLQWKPACLFAMHSPIRFQNIVYNNLHLVCCNTDFLECSSDSPN
jgi:hypothetical protein